MSITSEKSTIDEIETPEFLKRKRATSKMIVSKKINHIANLISSEEKNVELLEELIVQIQEKFREATTLHDKYIEATSDDENNDEWIIELNSSVDDCICNVRLHIRKLQKTEEETRNESLKSETDSIRESMIEKSITASTMKVKEWQEKHNSELVEAKFIWKGQATEVFLLGSFDNWKTKTRMDPRKDAHTKTLYLPESIYEYKFIIDGNWMHDPTCKVISDKQGGFNNVITVSRETYQIKEDAVEESSRIKPFENSAPVMWNQLKKVSIPKFSGNVRQYENWKATFSACIDNANVAEQLKLLQLREYLSGEALNVIDGLGHSESAYQIAKERLERKYGGKRRNIALYLEEITKFKPIRQNNSEDIEKLADLLDILVIKLKDSNKENELGSGVLYLQLQQKLPVNMLSNYLKWIHEKQRTESVLSLRDWIIQESEFYKIAFETAKGVTSNPRVEKTFYSQSNRKNNCCICNAKHSPSVCPIFLEMSTSQRWESAKSNKLCFRCLKKGHQITECRFRERCAADNCKEKHNTLLHSFHTDPSNGQANDEPEDPDENETTMYTNNPTTVLNTCDNIKEIISLRTIPVMIKHMGKSIKVNALLDDASTKSFISMEIANALGMALNNNTQMQVNVLNGATESFETASVDFEVQSLDKRMTTKMNAFTTRNVPADIETIDWNELKQSYNHLKDISFPKPAPKKVGLLIGLDYIHLHSCIMERAGKQGEPIARLTPLGWAVVGRISTTRRFKAQTTFTNSFFVKSQNDLQKLDETVRRFWEIEEVSEVSLSEEDKCILNATEKTFKRSENNTRYQVGIPWKENTNRALQGNNYTVAVKRLVDTEKQLKKKPIVKELYKNNMDTYIKKKYVKEVKDKDDIKNTKWYLPHFPVIKMDKTTSKVRMVMDAAAKYKNTCLNDTINQGPKLQNDIVDVLLRFRKNRVAVTCDIKEMFLQIEMLPEDRTYHRFLWRDTEKDKIQVFEFNRVVFGVTSSPFLANYVNQKNAMMFSKIYPRAVEAIIDSTYMDDTMDSVNSDSEALQLRQELEKIWQEAGMEAQKWHSNSTQFTSRKQEDEPVEITNLEKCLGILWDHQKDILLLKAKQVEQSGINTKRKALKQIASIFDPLGLISPITVKAKNLIQEMWLEKIDWDDPLTYNLQNKLNDWLDDLKNIDCLQFPRCITEGIDHQNILSCSIHVFVDSSDIAHAAVAYLRTVTKAGTAVHLISSKTKVSPLVWTSMPRLELMGAVLGVKLGKKIEKAIKIEDTTYWTDSEDILGWIRNRSKLFKPFVAHRVGEIQQQTDPVKWRYVPSTENPADIATRGCCVLELANNEMWINGPSFLRDEESKWPVNIERPTILSETRKTYSSFLILDGDVKRLNPERFSTWLRLVRVRAWINRFKGNLRTKDADRCKGELQPLEIEEAEQAIIREAQRESFPIDHKCLTKGDQLPKSSKLLPLNPQLDEDGLIRSNTRLIYADYLPYDVKHPIILPRKSWTTTLIIRYYHKQAEHGGTNQTLCFLTHKYWILCGREAIRDVEYSCMECKRRKAKAAIQIMAPLPRVRLTTMRAFTEVGLDYGGPFLTKQGRGKIRAKRYLCLFTCLSTRGIHIEMAYDMTTDSFLNAFWRMTYRRGTPTKVVSDNGSNFTLANKELKTLVENLDKNKITQETAFKGTSWDFNPPYSPHFGGAFECMIKAAKRSINKQLKGADVSDEQLITVMAGAESLINSRPITYQTANAKDLTPLTPNHFIIGQMGGEYAPEIDETASKHPMKRWRRVQEILQNFWKRWIQEWLPSIGQRAKWQKQIEDIKENDVVLVIDPETKRGTWPLGRITEVIPGKDNHVRRVKVLVKGKTLDRGINRIIKLCE